ncbi:MAG TPA: penicillin-binding transpeptidase domain-containing protein, partial [Candidatus Polarisedimenticolia bacterium]|nr:penicillin-binding transpeptidase domain-containing protein [Candidatus Polarisedimenticolia bacterium]
MKTLLRTDRAAIARMRHRLTALVAATCVWGGCIGYRLVDLQVARSDQMRALARKQQEQVITLDARRGQLYDRNGHELALSVEVDSVFGVPAEIEDPARTAAALAPALGLGRDSIPALAAKLTGDKLFVWVKRKVEPDVRAAVEALSLPGILFVKEHKRFYPHGDLASHVLGWAGMDNKGMEGLERVLDDKISGQNGQVFSLRDARRKLFLRVTRKEPVPGNHVVLTIDQTVQFIAQRELKRAIEDTGALAGSVIVMRPSTGDILAMANEPTFNLNRPGESESESRKNRAIVDSYEPGSTFKVITMAAALERDLVRAGERFDCLNGQMRVSGQLIRDHKPFGVLTASEILEQSSNVGAMKIGLRLREEDFYETIRSFGFGAKTNIELPGEAAGIVRAPKDWSGVSQATLSFGQELSVTPLQLVTAISSVANGGVLQPPRLVLKEIDRNGATVSETEPKPSTRILKQSTVASLKQMMLAVVEEGTAKAARMPGYSIAGKTGTAQKIGPDGRYSSNHFVASFVGFVPSSRPELTILVVLDEPRGMLYHGGDIAAPVFKRIALPALRYLRVPPEPGRLFEEGDDPTLQLAAHSRRWDKPMPVDEKERRAELIAEEKERLEMQRREARERAAKKAPEEEPMEPQARPLPAPAAVTAGVDVL